MIGLIPHLLLLGLSDQGGAIRTSETFPLDDSTQVAFGKKVRFALEASRTEKTLFLTVSFVNPTPKMIRVPPLGLANVRFWCVGKRNGLQTRKFMPYVPVKAFVRNLEQNELIPLEPLHALSVRFSVAMPRPGAGETLFVYANMVSYANGGKSTQTFAFASDLIPLPR